MHKTKKPAAAMFLAAAGKLLLAAALLAMFLLFAGCGCSNDVNTGPGNSGQSNADPTTPGPEVSDEAPVDPTLPPVFVPAEIPEGFSLPPDIPEDELVAIGSGEKHFILKVTPMENFTTYYLVSATKESVADALVEAELIDGADTEDGWVVTTVTGITAEPELDGTCWVFYINEDATSNISGAIVDPACVYSLVIQSVTP